MSTTQHVSTGRRAVVALLAVTALRPRATRSQGSPPPGARGGRGRARGDRGPPADRRQPCGHHRSGVRTRELPTRDDGGAPPLRGRPPADDPDVPVRAGGHRHAPQRHHVRGRGRPAEGRRVRAARIGRSHPGRRLAERPLLRPPRGPRTGASASRRSSSRPRRLGEHRVAVVLPTQHLAGVQLPRRRTATARRHAGTPTGTTCTVETGRPFLDRGVPPTSASYDLPFLRWLDRTGKAGRRPLATRPRRGRRADAAAPRVRPDRLPGPPRVRHEHEYDVIERYRDLGGNLAFLSANNFFWRVDRHGGR